MVHRKANKIEIVKRLFFIILGAVLVATSIEVFLVPNKIIDGGIVGISIMLSHLIGIPLGAFLIVLNIPFFILGYKEIGKTFVLSTILAIILMSIGTSVLHHAPSFTNDPLLAAVFGGIILGLGVGIIIRYGGCTDGIEVLAIVIASKTPLSNGQAIMLLNSFILTSAGFVFGWNSAMYSLIAYFIAFKLIDIVVEGLEKSKKFNIISTRHQEIGQAIQDRLGHSPTYITGIGGYSKEDIVMIYVIVNSLEESKLKSIIDEIDHNAFYEVNNVASVHGGRFKKRNIH